LDLQKAGEKIKVSNDALSQASENHRNVKNLFQQGMATSADLLEAVTLLLQAEVNNSGALVECQIARDRIKKAAGGGY
jgi:outer membrane protein TolC